MRRSTRIFRTSLDAANPCRANPRYICPSCQQQCHSQSILRVQKRYASNANLPWTEKVRRKIWGTDNPPGLADPYGGPSYLEQRRAEREGRTLREPGEAPEASAQIEQQQLGDVPEIAGSNFRPADDWKGLEVFGKLGHWSEQEPLQADNYSSFISSALLGGELEPIKGRFVSAAHQATVEIFSFATAGRSPLNVCDEGWHQDDILSVIQNTQATFSLDAGIQLIYPEGKDYSQDIASRKDLAEASETTDTVENAVEEFAEADPAEDLEDVRQSEFSEERNEYFAKYPGPKDQSFLALPLRDFNLRFIFMKRLTQLTGRVPTDSVLTHKVKDLSSLVESLYEAAKPKPTKVFDILAENNIVGSLPNVAVHSRKQTLFDKENRRGLAKVISKELEERGLVDDDTEDREQARRVLKA